MSKKYHYLMVRNPITREGSLLGHTLTGSSRKMRGSTSGSFFWGGGGVGGL